MGRMKYVQRRANRFEFRFPLPDDVAGKPVLASWPEVLAPLVNPRTGRFKTELIRSLQTTDSRAAERKALVHIAEAHALVDQARHFLRNGPPDDITRIRSLLLSVSTKSESCKAMRRCGLKDSGWILPGQASIARHDGLRDD